ncbi:MAG: hypothetical protein M3328_17755 [Chloroflexota bacterium]|nr:hypothetical protein [Chloroflexota bacterium]
MIEALLRLAGSHPAVMRALQDLPPNEIEFYDSVSPAMLAGDYQIEVTQTVQVDPKHGGTITYEHNQPMQVSGPHFGLAPDAVVSVYPADNSSSNYSTTLPNVVLSQRTLPWQIAVGDSTGTICPAGTPWMALLLLTEDEIVFPPDAVSTGNITGRKAKALRDYLLPPAGTLGPRFSPAQVQEYETEYPDLTVTVVEVKGDAFTAVAPRCDELSYLAHGRQASTGGQEVLGINADGWFAVVMGNRLPTGSKTGRYIAHLVSLEGFAGYLPGGNRPPGESDVVCLVSLATWTFISQESGGDFAALMACLDDGTLRMPVGRLLPNPQTPAEQAVADALSWGYTGLDYRIRSGEETVGWYRGPCLPQPVQRNMQPMYTSAEGAMVFDPTTGMFDLSFAVAWQTGRLLALANRQFVTGLLKWVRDNNNLSMLLQQRIELFEENDSLLALPEDISSLLESRLVQRLAREVVARILSPGGGSAGKPILGPQRDPSGLVRHLHELPGLLSPADIQQVLAMGNDVHQELVARVRDSGATDGKGGQ